MGDRDMAFIIVVRMANKTLRGITGMRVVEFRVAVEKAKIVEYRVRLEIIFILEK
jgi:dodecin